MPQAAVARRVRVSQLCINDHHLGLQARVAATTKGEDMRRLAGTVLIALLLGLAPAGAAFAESARGQGAPPSAVMTLAQTQDKGNDDGDDGLWGLVGLLGLLGLIPWRKRSSNRDSRGATRTSGM
ncbi:WGxxGxxG family protein [Actinacidiphila sp. DG2A-62]|uniref:WGxxGxxG family protein n=1 Tax=Actinacidiphila sp. DG2A-62 TaxID=3108821 RepID=UPI003FA37BE9